ncbi:MAG: HigA family addiction module antitoxin [Flavobacteriales bacterium]
MNSILHTAEAGDIIPGDVFHPGVFLADEIAYRGIRQADLARMLGISRPELSLVINGRRNMTIALAIKLEEALDIKAETWMNLQMRYEIDRTRKRLAEAGSKAV